MTQSRSKEHQSGSFLPVIALVLATALFFCGLALKSPASADPVAVIFAPGTTADEAFYKIIAMNGRVVRTGGRPNVIVAAFDEGTSFSRLRQHGAWATLNPRVEGACSSRSSQSNRTKLG